MSLFVRKITSIGAVDSGDNPESFITFWKRKEVSAPSAESTSGDEMSENLTVASPDADEEIIVVEKDRDELLAEIELLKAEIVALTPAADPVDEELAKASDEVQTLIAKQRAEIAEATEALAVEVAKRRDGEFVAKVHSDELEGLLGNADEVGPVLRQLSDAAPEAFEKIYPAMVAAAQRAGEFFKEFGVNAGEVDPVSRRDAWVAKRKQEGDDRSHAALAAAFWADHPDEREALRENN